MFGGLPEVTPKRENTILPEISIWCFKVFSYWATVNYRETYNIFACNGILFNHESPRRGETFVSKKITKGVANIFKKTIYPLSSTKCKRIGSCQRLCHRTGKILQQKIHQIM